MSVFIGGGGAGGPCSFPDVCKEARAQLVPLDRSLTAEVCSYRFKQESHQAYVHIWLRQATLCVSLVSFSDTGELKGQCKINNVDSNPTGSRIKSYEVDAVYLS